jgi:hypothetical protein
MLRGVALVTVGAAPLDGAKSPMLRCAALVDRAENPMLRRVALAQRRWTARSSWLLTVLGGLP